MTTEKGSVYQMLPIYRYRPLPENALRVLQLLPNRDGNAPIECNLIDYALLDARTGPHLYEAVSYVWGPPPNTHYLITNGASLPIRQNCHAVLARLRDPTLPRFLWVDAVCINQEDNDEKTDQVQLMTWIYASARGVLVWLEEPTDVCDLPDGTPKADLAGALKAIQEAAENSDALPLSLVDLEAARAMVTALSQRSWFRRIWVLQEVAAAARVTIMCNEKEIDGDVFCAGLEVMGVETDPKSRDKGIDATAIETNTAMLKEPASVRSSTWGLLSTAAFLIRGAGSRRNRASGMMQTYSLNISPLLDLVRMYHDRDATDRRDKIFALLGMSSNIPPGISTNYNVSWSSIFHDLTASIVGGRAVIKTEEDQEVAIIHTPFHILGTVSKVSRRSRLDNMQEVEVRLAGSKQVTTVGFASARSSYADFNARQRAQLPSLSMVGTITWVLQTPVVSAREGDIACILEGTAQPTILRPHHPFMHCIIIAIATTPQVTTRHKLPLGSLPLVRGVSVAWDWSFSDRGGGVGRDGIDDHRAALHVELMNRDFCRHKPLPLMALDIADWSRLAFQTGKGRSAVQEIEAFLSRVEEVDESSTFQMLEAIDTFRNLYKEVGVDFFQYHKRQALVWMADTLRSKEGSGYVAVTGQVLFTAILYKSDSLSALEKLRTVARYRSKDISITSEILQAAVGCFDQAILEWCIQRLDMEDQQVNVDLASVVNRAAMAGNYKAMALLVAQFGEQALVVSNDVAKALWHPKAKQFWPSQPAKWVKITWMPPHAGPLFDAWREKIPERVRREVLADLAEWHHISASIIELLDSFLDDWGNDDEIVASTMMAWTAGIKRPTSAEAFKSLLRRYRGDPTPMLKQVLISTIRNPHNPLPLAKIVLDVGGNRVPVSEEAMIAALLQDRKAEDMIKLLFDHYKDQVPVTAEVVDAVGALKDQREALRVLQLMQERSGERQQEVKELLAEKVIGVSKSISLEDQFYGTLLQEATGRGQRRQ
ncbi:heterokaryon incompatibility protein-domain-containing protein [Podospora aff. communis PSN243]|uniref:Heterokaryon incompatibility protein-domain-containing protein n=1 Tax=Podospora aff. communis PSN243 TaxID=3040156 RepID=A0AAV9GQP7_9PEZI|nr:heterokaryon incompatibility protein-domain-containing protein [Podospora aff. communis PSN243]